MPLAPFGAPSGILFQEIPVQNRLICDLVSVGRHILYAGAEIKDVYGIFNLQG
jgi:hypothetical protein